MNARERLELFVARAREVSSRRAVANAGLRHIVTVRLEQGGQGRVEETAPDEEEFLAFLVTFRRFISDEPVNLHGIFNLCELHVTDEILKQRLREAREAWKAIRTSVMEFVIDGQKLTPEETARLWIQGRIFHDDPEKAALLDRVPPPFQALVRSQAMGFIAGTTDIILYVAAVISKALGEDSVRFHEESEGSGSIALTTEA